MNQLLVVLGPTASGKTALAIKLAKKFKGEIINADSTQVYQGMEIGTDQPNLSTKGGSASGGKTQNSKLKTFENVPHHLFGFLKPNQKFNVAQYKKLAVKIIKDIQKRGKLPILVGGAGLYIQAIVENLEIPNIAPDWRLRQKLEKQIKTKGPNYLWQKLLKLNPVAAKFVDKKNPRRLIRALEVCLKSGQPSNFHQKGQPLFDCLLLGLNPPRTEIYRRADQRVEKQIKNGLLEEVKKLLNKYPDPPPPLGGFVYREVISYLQDKIDLETMKQKIKWANHDYVRRQLTWFKKMAKIKWIKNLKQAETNVKKFIREKNDSGHQKRKIGNSRSGPGNLPSAPNRRF